MARPRKQKTEDVPSIEPIEDFPILHNPGDHGGIFDNVIPFGGNQVEAPQTETQDTQSIDSFLAQYGINLV